MPWLCPTVLTQFANVMLHGTLGGHFRLNVGRSNFEMFSEVNMPAKYTMDPNIPKLSSRYSCARIGTTESPYLLKSEHPEVRTSGSTYLLKSVPSKSPYLRNPYLWKSVPPEIHTSGNSYLRKSVPPEIRKCLLLEIRVSGNTYFTETYG